MLFAVALSSDEILGGELKMDKNEGWNLKKGKEYHFMKGSRMESWGKGDRFRIWEVLLNLLSSSDI